MRSVLLIALCLCFLAGDATAQEDSGHDGIQRQLADYPALPNASLSDVINFRLEKNDLTLYTRIPPTLGRCRIKIDKLDGLSVINIPARHIKPVGQYMPPILEFLHFVFPSDSTTSLTSILVSPMNMQISHDFETATTDRQVLLMQNWANAPGDDEAHVRLSIIELNKETGSKSIDIHRAAPDIVTLRRLYPQETTKFLEPIFRELSADAVVFSPDEVLAWQVFAAQAQPDPAVAQKVKQIIPRLDVDDFHGRESATNDLKSLGEPAAVVLWHMDRANLSAEQSSRIGAFLGNYQPVTDDQARQLGHDVGFLLQCLRDNDNFIVDAALRRLREITGHEIAFDRSLQADARRAEVDKLSDQLLPTTQPTK